MSTENLNSGNEKSDGKMNMSYIMSIKNDRIKVRTTEDAYRIFVSLFAYEEKFLHEKEHLWVIAIDDEGYASCAYLAALGLDNIRTLNAFDLFRSSIQNDVKKIILGHNQVERGAPKPDENDLDYTNLIYHKARHLNIEVDDHIIITRDSLTTIKPIYYSYKDGGVMEIIAQDITHQTIDEATDELDREREDAREEGSESRAIEIASNLLKERIDLKIISECTMLSLEKIREIDEGGIA